MERVRQSQAETVAYALDLLPDRLLAVVGCDVFCEDPIFAGVTAWESEDASFGRSYRDTAHVLYPYHARDRRLTVVMPQPVEVATVLHELGHVLHWTLMERSGRAMPRFRPVTDYATTDPIEEFAEAFTQWFYSPQLVEAHPAYWSHWDRESSEWFDRVLTA